MRVILLSSVVAVVHAFGLAHGAELCPTVIASLMNVPGNLDATTSAQRVEVRQCVVNAARKSGSVQLVAWARNSRTPDLLLDLEEAGFHQIAMVEGVYAFELIGGKASQLIVIAFEAGKAKVVAEDSALDRIVITSDRTNMRIDVFDNQKTESPKVRHYEFKAGREESRRH